MQRHHAPLTHGLALLCAGIHIMLILTGWQQWAILSAGFIPERWNGLAYGPAVPALLSPLTAALLHANVVHLAFNLVMLVFIGRQLEPALSSRGLAILLLAGVFGGAIVEWLAADTDGRVVIGASGAISALVAAFAFIFNRNDVRGIGPIPPVAVRAVWLAAAWIGIQLAVGFAAGGQIAIWAHIGGFLAGLALTRPLLRWRFR